MIPRPKTRRLISPLAFGTLLGPDQRWWFPVFTDMNAVLAYQSRDCAQMPAVSIARVALATPDTLGLVVNPTAAGGGQPIERAGVDAIANGFMVGMVGLSTRGSQR